MLFFHSSELSCGSPHYQDILDNIPKLQNHDPLLLHAKSSLLFDWKGI